MDIEDTAHYRTTVEGEAGLQKTSWGCKQYGLGAEKAKRLAVMESTYAWEDTPALKLEQVFG